MRVPSGGASGKVGSGHSTFCAASTAVLPTLLTTRTSPGGHRRRARCQALRRRPALPGSRPPSQPPLLPPCSHAPRACICFEPCLLSTFRTRSRRTCTRLTSTPPRCSSQRWPAFAGPSRVAEKAGGIWLQGAVDCQSSSRASPEAGDPPASVLFWGCCILTATWYAPKLGVGRRRVTCPRMPPMPADRRLLAFGKRGGGCILGDRTLLEACLAVATP